jgi:hypothetical protein
MKREQLYEHICPKEQELTAALSSGMLDAELLAHAAACTVCADVLLVADNLQKDNASLKGELGVLDAAVVWKRAQTRAKAQAIAKATLPIRIARVCTCVFAVVAALRLLIELSNHPTWLSDLGIRSLPVAGGNWLAAFSGTTALCIVLSVVLLGVSSWYMLRQE